MLQAKKFELDKEDNCLPFTFDLPESSLIFIDRVTDKVYQQCNRVLSEAILLGIDTETRPSFYTNRRHSNNWHTSDSSPGRRENNNNKNPTALLQIAVRTTAGEEYVLLFDLLTLLASMTDNTVKTLQSLQNALESNNIIKIGQGLDEDFKELNQAYPKLACFQKVNAIVETNALLRCLDPEILMLKSLKYFVKTYLHSNLIKTQQVSDWGKRPLHQKQIYYAACDALVLVRLFDAMTCEIEIKEAEKEQPNIFDVKSLFLHYPDCLKTHRSGLERKPRESKIETPSQSKENVEIPVQLIEKIEPKSMDSPVVEKFHNPLERKFKLDPSSSIEKEKIHVRFDSVEETSQSKRIKTTTTTKIPSRKVEIIKSKDVKVWRPLHVNPFRNAMAIGEQASKFLQQMKTQR